MKLPFSPAADNAGGIADHARLHRKQTLRSYMTGLLFLSPWLVGLAWFVAYPLVYSVYLSFNKIGITADGSGLAYTYVGWDNYKYAFLRDNVFPIEMFDFVRQTLLIIPVTVIFALLVAIMLNQKFSGRLIFRTIFFLPVIFATGKVLLELFTQGQGELPFVSQLGVEDMVYELFPASLAGSLMGIIDKFIIILWFSGIQVIIFLAAFQTIPPSTYEAAQIDGATPWETFWKITFPSTTPFITLNLIYTVVDQSTNPFNPILEHILKNVSDQNTGYGYASALGWIYFVFIFALIVCLLGIAYRLNGRKR